MLPIPPNSALVLSNSRDDQPTQEVDSHTHVLHTGATQAERSSPDIADDLRPVRPNKKRKISFFIPRQGPTASMPIETYSEHEYWQNTGLDQDSRRRNGPPVDLVRPDLVRLSHMFLEENRPVRSIASATQSWFSSLGTPSDSPLCSEIHRKHQRVDISGQPESTQLFRDLRGGYPKNKCCPTSETSLSIDLQSLKRKFLTYEMSDQSLRNGSPPLPNQVSTRFLNVDQGFVTDGCVHICGDDRFRYIDRSLEKTTFPGQGSPSKFVTAPVTNPAGFQSGTLRGSSLLTSTGRSECAYIPTDHDDRQLVPQAEPSNSPHARLDHQHRIVRRTPQRAGVEAYPHSGHTSPTNSNDCPRPRGSRSLMDRHPDVDHSFTSSALQKIALQYPNFQEIYSKPTSNQDRLPTTDRSALLPKDIRASHRGLPSRHKFTAAIDAYLSALSSKKLPKALITQKLYKDIIFNLRCEKDGLPGIGTPQFRFWCRKHFSLKTIPRLRLREQVEIPHSVIALPIGSQDHGDSGEVEVVTHEGQPVVTRETIYEVLSKCHTLANHSGRDKTTAIVKQHYSWVPKVLIGNFIKLCPFCCSKRTSGATWTHSWSQSDLTPH